MDNGLTEKPFGSGCPTLGEFRFLWLNAGQTTSVAGFPQCGEGGNQREPLLGKGWIIEMASSGYPRV